jgi:hypothetical protein
MPETTTYKINQTGILASQKCKNPECGHSFGAHGSNGLVCAACPCRRFMEKVPSE